MKLIESNNLQDIILGILLGEFKVENYYSRSTDIYDGVISITTESSVKGVIIHDFRIYFIYTNNDLTKSGYLCRSKPDTFYERYFKTDEIYYTDNTITI